MNQWYHYVVQKNASGNYELWVDGSLFYEFSSSNAYASSRSGSNGLRLGKNNYGEAFKGSIDTVLIYDLSTTGVLTQSDISDLFVGNPNNPPIINFWSNDININYGEFSTLTWDVIYAETATIDNGIGSVILSDSIIVMPTATTTYTLTATGNHGTESKTVTINVDTSQICNNDETPPEITLIGDNPLSHTLGAIYDDPGATALDNCDGDLTTNIVVSNPVNFNQAGIYKITYNVTDSSGNIAQTIERIVMVQSNQISDGTINYEYDDAGRVIQIIREIN